MFSIWHNQKWNSPPHNFQIAQLQTFVFYDTLFYDFCDQTYVSPF